MRREVRVVHREVRVVKHRKRAQASGSARVMRWSARVVHQEARSGRREAPSLHREAPSLHQEAAVSCIGKRAPGVGKRRPHWSPSLRGSAVPASGSAPGPLHRGSAVPAKGPPGKIGEAPSLRREAPSLRPEAPSLHPGSARPCVGKRRPCIREAPSLRREAPAMHRSARSGYLGRRTGRAVARTMRRRRLALHIRALTARSARRTGQAVALALRPGAFCGTVLAGDDSVDGIHTLTIYACSALGPSRQRTFQPRIARPRRGRSWPWRAEGSGLDAAAGGARRRLVASGARLVRPAAPVRRHWLALSPLGRAPQEDVRRRCRDVSALRRPHATARPHHRASGGRPVSAPRRRVHRGTPRALRLGRRRSCRAACSDDDTTSTPRKGSCSRNTKGRRGKGREVGPWLRHAPAARRSARARPGRRGPAVPRSERPRTRGSGIVTRVPARLRARPGSRLNDLRADVGQSIPPSGSFCRSRLDIFTRARSEETAMFRVGAEMTMARRSPCRKIR